MDDRFILMELELIEPELFLWRRKGSADRLAACVVNDVGWRREPQ